MERFQNISISGLSTLATRIRRDSQHKNKQANKQTAYLYAQFQQATHTERQHIQQNIKHNRTEGTSKHVTVAKVQNNK